MGIPWRELPAARVVSELERLRRSERGSGVDILAGLSEVERRSIHVDLGHASLFDFCVEVLGYHEGAAWRRIYSARAAARFPALYVYMRDGEVSLSAAARLWPHLTAENVERVLARACRKRHRDVEELILELIQERKAREAAACVEAAPAPPPEFFRPAASGEPSPAPRASEPPKRDVIRSESPDVVRISFQANAALRSRIERLKDVLARACPSGRLEDVFAAVIDDYLFRHDPARKAPSPERPPRAVQTRRIPRWVKDRVWSRDGGRCAYVADDGRRCGARRFLEYDHVKPWALGGPSDDPENVRLPCGTHNRRRAALRFGERAQARDPSGPGAAATAGERL